ncbi:MULTISPECIES: Spy/CpxP family protein refolding chaperone [unclassified Thermosynechococcus]|uniref:Spy/CpxP family protein refolding chaperone n=1 Tax=unclassified Thermosynechococcus TaxID=2622553 RepID=UPI00197DC576|nr:MULTISPECIES: Spy/CpxP family protein refolding chaperone [unclassified Thermosynechococcus]MDR7897845.1 Spy/CpxP family protein refolding chaperone [Thermosynechococcus sp. JY1332]MDR7905244.1 Spy/CpxP family protein refolding chaperone [Thermosynechococcus sp. JY1334]MDR7922831.1 Spy/CpxP family protein refolding chaperone [Thermosynechococcus sp. HY213]MDR7993069.1 Spy/CpxP family protein refolding chaperone [Thermosynechococcus sp. TG252]QSF48666.1 Spy/CpxP family protein refolding chap
MKKNIQRFMVAIALIIGISGTVIPPQVMAQTSGGLLTAEQMKKLNLSVEQKQAVLRLTLRTNDRILRILDRDQQRIFRNAIKQGKSTGEAMDAVSLRPDQKTQLSKVMQDTRVEMLTILTPEQVKQLQGSR